MQIQTSKPTHTNGSQPMLHQHGREIQPFGTLRNLPLALSIIAREESCKQLNQILADNMILFSQTPTSRTSVIEFASKNGIYS